MASWASREEQARTAPDGVLFTGAEHPMAGSTNSLSTPGGTRR